MRKVGIFLLVLILYGFMALVSSCNKQSGTKPGQGEKQVGLIRFKMEPGEIVGFRRTDKVDMEEGGVWGVKLKYLSEIDIILNCEEVDEEGNMIIKQSWDRASVKGVWPKGEFKWRSEDGPQVVPELAKRYSKLAGKSITVRMSPEGELLELWNGEVIADAILCEKGIRVGSDMDEEVYKEHQQEVTQEVFESREHILDNVLPDYPDREMANGDIFTIYEKFTTSNYAIQEMEMTFCEVLDGQACFNAKAAISCVGEDATADPGFVSEVTAKGQGKGAIKLDSDNGMINYAKVVMKVKTHCKAQLGGISGIMTKERTMEGTMTTILSAIE
ncbi:MAG: hypothetical protein JXD22_00905 [Sedimentisphaerales bacterium]|nr:hypothetical protein [Sedimentisphaerales bacterium]